MLNGGIYDATQWFVYMYTVRIMYVWKRFKSPRRQNSTSMYWYLLNVWPIHVFYHCVNNITDMCITEILKVLYINLELCSLIVNYWLKVYL